MSHMAEQQHPFTAFSLHIQLKANVFCSVMCFFSRETFLTVKKYVENQCKVVFLIGDKSISGEVGVHISHESGSTATVCKLHLAWQALIGQRLNARRSLA
jgi:hypothetical protein